MKDIREMRRIAPSHHNPFEAYVEGDLNMTQRLKAAAMAAKIASNRRRNPHQPETYVVRLELEQRVLTDPVRFASIPCPVITISKDRRRILVIAPDGSDQWVDWK